MYVRRLYSLFLKYRERETEEKGFDWMLLCCFEPLYNKFYLLYDVVYWWCELDYNRWRRMNLSRHRFVARRSLTMPAMPPCERDVLYQAVQDVWCNHENARALDISIPVVFFVHNGYGEAGNWFGTRFDPKVAGSRVQRDVAYCAPTLMVRSD